MPQKTNGASDNGYGDILRKLNATAAKYAPYLTQEAMAEAFYNAGMSIANQPQLQNARVKAISSLPVDYTKEDIGAFLRNPYGNEAALRQTAEVLRWTAYPFFKIGKTYQDIATYRYYSAPLYLGADEADSKEFQREATLIDKLNRALTPNVYAHKITGQAMSAGKVFYTLRVSVDKPHNAVNYAFMQQLPQDWCTIIGYNSISGYTVSFNMMYFLTPGTDWRQFGELFAPYIEDFNRMFGPPKDTPRGKYVYASTNAVETAHGRLNIYPENLNPAGEGKPQVWQQNGRWMYWVSLPIDKVWTFEVDDATPATASPLAGLMLTYAQQSDYEAAQLSLLLNPLIKIFTGEMPYYDSKSTQKDDAYRLSNGGRIMFQALFDQLMARNNTAGATFFMAPVENIKSHDFAESANANDISESFNRYGMEKAGLTGLIPATDDVKASQVDVAAKLESRFATATIYAQFERMMNRLYSDLNLRYEWQFKMFGSALTEAADRDNAMRAIANGDVSAHFILSALDGESWLGKIAQMRVIKASGILDMLIPPLTSYTAKQETSGLPPQGGRPETTELTDEKEEHNDIEG